MLTIKVLETIVDIVEDNARYIIFKIQKQSFINKFHMLEKNCKEYEKLLHNKEIQKITYNIIKKTNEINYKIIIE